MADNLLPGRYSVGAASVDAGGTIVTPTGATWTDNVWGDDLFFLPSQPLVPPQRIESVHPVDGTIVLAYPFPGATATEEPYEVRYVGIIERSTAQSRRVLEQLGDVKAWYDIIVGDDAARLALESPTSPLRSGYRVLVKDDGVIWAKASSAFGDWIGPVEFKGDKGSKGWSPQIVAEADGERRAFKLAGYVGGEGLVPTDNVGQYLKADGTWTSTIGDAADFRGEGFIFMGAYNGAANYAKGNVARESGSSWIALQPTAGNSPPTLPTTSNAYWALLSQKGQDGTGTGDVVGPASAVNERIAVWDGLTGKLLKDGGKTIAQILAEAIPVGYDDLQFTVSQLAMAMADALNVAQFLGPNGNRFADSFDTLTYVDVAGATNLDTSVTGLLKATRSGTTVAFSTPSGTYNPGAYLIVDRRTITNGLTVAKLGVHSSSAASNIELMVLRRNSAASYTCMRKTGLFSHPGGGWYDVALLSPYAVPGTGEYVIGVFTSGPTLSACLDGGSRAYAAGVNPSLDGTFTATEDAGSPVSIFATRYVHTVIPANLTVRSAGLTAAATPAAMKALVNVKEVEAAVAGTDYTVDCSRDDGTTWSAMTLAERYSTPSGLRVVEAAETDVSGQPSGTVPRWRFKTLNNKNVELHDVYLYWS